MSFLNDLSGRFKRLVLTFVAKKYVAWAVSIWLLLSVIGVAGWEAWLLFTSALFAIDAYSKTQIKAG